MCVNCSGPHDASDRQCPAWLKEKSVIKIDMIKMYQCLKVDAFFNRNLILLPSHMRKPCLDKDMLKSPEFFILLKQAVSEAPIQ